MVEVPAGCLPSTCQNIIASELNQPNKLALDAAGDLFIADSGSQRVLEVPAGCTATSCQITVAALQYGPSGLAVNAAGDVFAGDGNRILKIQRSQGPALTFAATDVNSTSSDSPQSVEIENIGNAALAAIAPGLSVRTNFAQVAGSGTPADCTAAFSLAPGAACNLSIDFTPTVSGALHSGATLTDNALNGNPPTQTIALNGTGIALAQTITFNPIPNQVQGTSVSLAASASSGLPVSFASLTPSVCTLSGAAAMLVNPGTCTIQGRKREITCMPPRHRSHRASR